jgi:hypothetical protein
MMERRRKRILLSGIAAGIVCIIVGVLIFVLWGGPRDVERVNYPPLDPGEKLPHPAAGMCRHSDSRVRKFELDGPFPEMPTEMLVYKIGKPKEMSETDVRKMANKYFDIPMDAEALHGTTSYVFKTENLNFNFDRETGNFSMHKYEKARIGLSKDRRDYPSDRKCRAIAVKFAKSRGFLPSDVYVSGIREHAKSEGYISVTFGRMISGYKSFGSGSRMIIRIGVGGEVIHVMRQWLVIEPYKMAPRITPEEAFEAWKRGDAINASDGKVEEITLSYAADGLAYVQPIYYFRLERGYDEVPAVKREHLLTIRETADIEVRNYYEQLRAKDPNK